MYIFSLYVKCICILVCVVFLKIIISLNGLFILIFFFRGHVGNCEMDWDIHVFSVNIQNTHYRGRKCIKWNKYFFFYIFLCSNKIDFSILARFNSHGSGQYILMIFSFLQASERLSRRYSCDLCEYAATGEKPQNSG